MNVPELYALTVWVDEHIRTPSIVAKFEALRAALHKYAQPNQQGQAFETQKQQLIEALEAIPLHSLTKDQLKFLGSLGIASVVGQEGVENIENLLYKNVIDVATSAAEIGKIVVGVTNGLAKSKLIRDGLSECVSDEEYEVDDEVMMRIYFTGNAAMSNISEFKRWGRTWFDIGRGLALAHGLKPDDVKIVGATRGSIVIEMAVVSGIATTASFIILRGLKIAEKVLDLRMKAEELRGMKLKNEKIAQELEDEADAQKKEGIEQIAAEAAKELNLHNSKSGDVAVALRKTVQEMLGFVENGGEVDFVIPDEDPDSDEDVPKETLLLRTTFEEIRRIESKISLIEHKPKDDA